MAAHARRTCPFTSSFAGSETITSQILQGVGAEVALLASERDAERLREGRAVVSDWRTLPHQGIVNQTPFIYELEGLLMKEAGAAIEIIMPEATILSEHQAVIVDRNVTTGERPLVEAFVRYLWSAEAQRAFAQYYFRPVVAEGVSAPQSFAPIKMPFTVAYFGGWGQAYPEIIERVWRDQAQRAGAK